MKTPSQPTSATSQLVSSVFNFCLSPLTAARRAAVCCFGTIVMVLAMSLGSTQAGTITNLINVQYRGLGTETHVDGVSYNYSGAGVVGSAGDFWNAQQVHYYTGPGSGNIISGVALNNSANSASGLTLTVGYGEIVEGATYYAAGRTAMDTATTNLMQSCINIYTYTGSGASGSKTTHTIGGLSGYNGATANMVVYAGASSARSTEIKMTGGATGGNSSSNLTTSSTSRKLSDGVGVAYNVFTNVTLNGGNLVFTVDEAGAGSSAEAGYVNGFQLQILTPDPNIATQPTSRTNGATSTASFSVTASGTSPFSYQWQATNAAGANFTNIVNDGIKYGGATNATLYITNCASADQLAYQVIVTNVNGAITSSVVNLTVTDPVITSQPVSKSALVGSTASFSVTAAGGSSFTYAWQATNNTTGFTNIPGATSSTLSIPGVTSINALNYRVIATDNAGSITSSVVSLTVVSPMLVDVQFLGQSPSSSGAPGAYGAGSAYSGPAIVGSAGDTWNQEAYPYYNQNNPAFNGVSLVNSANSASGLTLTVAGDGSNPVQGAGLYGTATDAATTNLMSAAFWQFGITAAGAYTCTVTIGGLSAYAGINANLVVYAGAPSAQTEQIAITGGVNSYSPSGTQTTSSSSRKLSAGAGVAYQIFTNGTLTGGNLTFTINNTSAANNANTAYINGLQLDIYGMPLIATQPLSQTNVAGQNVQFSVAASGGILTYQWQTNGVNVGNGGIFSGATSNVLTLTAAPGSSPLSYDVVLANNVGSVTSSVATLSLSPHITAQPAALQATTVNGSASFSVTADGSPALTYQWQATNSAGGFTNLVDTGAFSGSATPTLSITPATAAQALTYQVVVGNTFGSVTSTPPSVLTVSSAPVITVNPLSQTNNAGATVNLSVTATGTAPLAYQWFTNGVTGATNVVGNGGIVSGATNSTLTLTGISDPWALSYQVIVTNSSGSATSSPALLTVIDPPVIASSPASQSVLVGATVNFTVTTNSGTAPFTYTWQTNGVNLGNGGIVSGATTATLTLTGVTTNYALNYQVILTNAAGSVTSSPVATLTVHTPPTITTNPAPDFVVSPGATATFTVAAAGDPSLIYQWQATNAAVGGFTNLVDNGQISGSTTTTLTISNANTPVALAYQVVVNNNYGSATSSLASLTLGKLINVQYLGQAGETYHDGHSSIGYTGAAVLGAPGDTWNQEQVHYYSNSGLGGGATANLFTGAPLVNAGNNASGLSLGLAYQSIVQGAQYNGTPTDLGTTNLMDSCVSIFAFTGDSGPNNAKTVHTIGGLSGYAGQTAILVVYAGAPSARTEEINLTGGATGGNSGTQLTTSSTSRQLSAGVGVAYNTYTNITLTGGNLVFTVNDTSALGNNDSGMVNGFQLLIQTPDPLITTNPVSLTEPFGAPSATFTVAATGSTALNYQWQATNSAGGGWTNLVDVVGAVSGSQSNILTFTSVTANEALTYQVVVANGSGSVTSTPASLNVVTIPIITSQPAPQTVLSGNNATFNVGATGLGTLAYQWQATNAASGGFTNLSDVAGLVGGSATSALTLTNVSTSQSLSSYQVIITNVNGSATSTPALLTVLPSSQLIDVDIGTGSGTQTGAAILGQSGDAWNVVSQGTISSVFNAGNITLGGVTIGDSADGSYATPSPAVDAATAALMSDFNYNIPGHGPVPVTITGLGLYTNSVFTLVVYAGMDPGQPCTENITTGASGGNTTSTLSTTSATRKLSDGIGVAYNIFTGTLTNGTLTFTVSGASYHGFNGLQLQLAPSLPPLITSEPVSRTNYVGTTATFSVSALTATGTLSYQWQANGTTGFTNLVDGGVISGSQSSELTNSSVATTDGLTYQVVVSNGSGSVTSSPASLTVYTYPVAGPSFTIGATIGIPSTVLIVGGKYSPTNADGLPLTITGVTGETNGTVTTDGTSVTYTATNGTTDSFTYTVSDGHSGTASQTVSVAISAAATATGFNQVSAQLILGQAVLTYLGIPGDNYALYWTHSLAYPITWTPLFTNTAAVNGYLNFTNTPSGGSDFYRTRFVP